MLTGKELGAAIDAAITLKGVKPADVARHFKIKPPSVNGWVATGRIGKDKLSDLFNYFADVVGPEHWGMAPSSIQAAGHQLVERTSPVTPTSSPGADANDSPSLPVEDAALLEAFHALSKKERRKLLAEAQYRATLAIIEAEEAPPDPIPSPK